MFNAHSHPALRPASAGQVAAHQAAATSPMWRRIGATQRHGLKLMGLLALATWPQLAWMARRMADGSDDPLGLLALLALLALLLAQWGRWRPAVAGWQWLALCLAAVAMGLQAFGPALLAALAAMLAMACGIRALLPRQVATAPVLLLAVLSLPLLASLQFFVGYPLRVLVAEITRHVLGLWQVVERSGAALKVDGQLVLVDAACSGVQLAWLGYFCAACIGLWHGLPSRQFLARLPLVGACVLLGNVLRSAVLVAAQADGQALPVWLHEGIGLLTIAAMVWVVALLMRPRPAPAIGMAGGPENRPPASPAHTPRSRVALPRQKSPLQRCMAALARPLPRQWPLGLLLAVGLLQAAVALQASPAPQAGHTLAEWPREWAGTPLRPLALSAVEQRFAQQFPGQLARLTNGQQVLTWRHVNQPTRMLHPAADCFRALGYAISEEKLIAEETLYPSQNQIQGTPASAPRLWRCLVATQGDTRLRVCERIEDAQGRVFTDTSAWYWAAQLGQSAGPWQALTVAQPL